MLAIFITAFIAVTTLGVLNCDINGVSEKACFEKPTIEYVYPSSHGKK